MKPQQIKAIRQQMGMTQVEMAQHLGITRRHYQNLEAGKKMPPAFSPIYFLLQIMSGKGRAWVNKTWKQIDGMG